MQITVNDARTMHISELRGIDHPMARRQVGLREQGSEVVRGVLRTVIGASRGADWAGYRDTHGWYITAYATPDRTIGLVNIATGVAVITGITLDSETIEALTVPGQGEGPQASGAAAWTAPDAGEAKAAEAPRGWTQLVIDLRGTVPAVPCVARICAWGLRTCYGGRRGAPGAQHLDAHPTPDTMPADEWPVTPEQRARMRAAGEPILRRMALHLAEIAGIRAEIETALSTEREGAVVYATQGPGAPRLPSIDIPAAIAAAGAYGYRSDGYAATGALRSAVSQITDVAPDALRRAGAGRLCAVADVSNVRGMQYWDLLRALVIRILERDLEPVAQALWSAALPHVSRTRDSASRPGHVPPSVHHLHQQIVRPAMARMAADFADEVLRGLCPCDSLGESVDYGALCDALYADGYVELDMEPAK